MPRITGDFVGLNAHITGKSKKGILAIQMAHAPIKEKTKSNREFIAEWRERIRRNK